ncbi:MAG: hypothetical protein Q9169_006343 [Polycauliona sp. 2 TL-2023]
MTPVSAAEAQGSLLMNIQMVPKAAVREGFEPDELSRRGDCPATWLDVALPPGPLYTRCDGFGFCEKDDHGVVFGETMEEHLFAHAIYVSPTGFGWFPSDSNHATQFPSVSPLEVGDVVAYSDEYKQRMSSGILSTVVYKWSEGLFIREIAEPAGGEWITFLGYLVVERPFPDEHVVFEQLAQDLLLAGIATGLRPEVDPSSLIPSPTSGCAQDECIQFIASADVFYFGPDPTNTACSSAIKSPLPLPTPPPISMDPASVYVVYQSIQIFDKCRRWIGGNPPFTASFRSDTLSTLEYRTDGPPATKVMDFADLPCPPSHIADFLNPEVPYSPILKQLFRTYSRVNTSDSDVCDQAAVIDPPIKAVRVGEISGREEGGNAIA